MGLEKGSPLLLIVVDGLLPTAARGDVVHASGELGSQGSGYGARRSTQCWIVRPDPPEVGLPYLTFCSYTSGACVSSQEAVLPPGDDDNRGFLAFHTVSSGYSWPQGG